MSVQYGLFLKSLLDNPKLFNALLPNSNQLAHQITSMIDLHRNDRMIELSPGQGVITRHLLAKSANQENYLGIEREAIFFDKLREEFPFSAVEHELLEDARLVMNRKQWNSVKFQILSLPLSGLSNEEAQNTLEAVRACASENGEFIGFQYLHSYKFEHAIAMRTMIEQQFGPLVETKLVMWNLPPVFLFRWKKRAANDVQKDQEELDKKRVELLNEEVVELTSEINVEVKNDTVNETSDIYKDTSSTNKDVTH